MFDWFFNWLDPKIIKLERWVHRKAVQPMYIDINLEKMDDLEIREYQDHLLANCLNGDVLEYLQVTQTEALALLERSDGHRFWRYRYDGITEDHAVENFEDLREFFEKAVRSDMPFGTAILRSTALQLPGDPNIHTKERQ